MEKHGHRFCHFMLPIALGFFLFASGCQAVLFSLYGIKKPRPVSAERLVKKSLAMDIDTTRLYVIRPEGYAQLINSVKTLPNIWIYNRLGNRIHHEIAPDACKAGAETLIDQLNLDSAYNHREDGLWFPLVNNLEHLHGADFLPDQLPDADFYVVVFWGTFLGKLNQQYLPAWTRAALQHSNASVCTIYISCDMRK